MDILTTTVDGSEILPPTNNMVFRFSHSLQVIFGSHPAGGWAGGFL